MPKLAPALLCTLLALTLAAPAAAKSPLAPDPSFGKNGVVEPDLGPRFGYTAFTSIRVEPDGSLFTGRRLGGYWPRLDAYRRYDAAGNLDPSYSPRREGPSAEAPGGEGKVLRVGSNFIERLNPDGTRDPTFGNKGVSDVIPLETEMILPLPSGAFAVAGSSDAGSREGRQLREAFLALFDRDGHLDRRFGGDGLLRPRTDTGIATERLVDMAPYGAEGVIAAFNRWARPNDEGTPVKPGGSTIVAFGADGKPDPAFGNGGTLRWDSSIEAIEALPDGGLVVAGNLWGKRRLVPGKDARHSDIYVARLNASGQLDPGFDADGVATVDFNTRIDLAGALLAEPDGSVLVGGTSVNPFDDVCRFHENFCKEMPVLARLLPDGSPDLGFGKEGKVRLGRLAQSFVALGAGRGVTALAALPGGGLVAGGGSGTVAFLTELDRAGAVNTGFGEQGVVIERDPEGRTETTVNAVAVDSRRRILVTGTTDAGIVESSYGLGVVFRFLPDGRLDRSFGNSGQVRIPGEPRAIAVSSNDSAFVLSGENDPNLVTHISPKGRFDRHFGSEGVALLHRFRDLFHDGKRIRMETNLHSIAATESGGVLVGGGQGSETGLINRIVLVQLDRHGLPVTRFSGDGAEILALGKTGECNLVQLKPRSDGRILIAGRIRLGRRGPRPLLAQVNPNGTLDRSFGRGGFVTVALPNQGIATSLALRRGGGVLLAGEHGNRESRRRPFLLAFDRHGRPDRDFNRRSIATPRRLLPSGGNVGPREILQAPGQLLTFAAKRKKPLLAFSPRGTFAGSPPFEPGNKRPQRFPAAAALQGSNPIVASQIGIFGGFVLQRYR